MAKKSAGSGGKVRSAVSGRYVKASAAKRSPGTTVTETTKKKGK